MVVQRKERVELCRGEEGAVGWHFAHARDMFFVIPASESRASVASLAGGFLRTSHVYTIYYILPNGRFLSTGIGKYVPLTDSLTHSFATICPSPPLHIYPHIRIPRRSAVSIHHSIIPFHSSRPALPCIRGSPSHPFPSHPIPSQLQRSFVRSHPPTPSHFSLTDLAPR